MPWTYSVCGWQRGGRPKAAAQHAADMARYAAGDYDSDADDAMEQLERERVQAEQRPSGQFAADMEERMAVLKAAGVTSAPDSAAMARTNSV